MKAESDRFRLMAEFADEYRWVPDDGPVLSGTERLVQWGGDGTPGVAEFCTLEIAAALRLTEEQVRLDIGAALSVRHRLPGAWQKVMDGVLRVWQARDLAQITHDLTYFQALDLDEEIGPLIGPMSFSRLRTLVRARVLDITRAEAQSEHERLKAGRRVDFTESCRGFTDLAGTLDASDALFLDAQLDRIAAILGEGGSQDSRQVRRALALGVLASPARALQLLQASLTDELPTMDPECPARGQRGHLCGQITVDPQQLLPKAELVIHLSEHAAKEGQGLIRGEKIGPLLAGWVKDLVGHSRVTIRPVLDPADLVATDSYECPPRMREWVELRNAYEVFPFSKRVSKGLDIDHTTPWESTGKPTRPDNLGPLSRKVHRAKTHGGWRLDQPSPAVFRWESPLGFGYLVTPSNSWMITDPSHRILPPVAV